jgi:hypothetical protein
MLSVGIVGLPNAGPTKSYLSPLGYIRTRLEERFRGATRACCSKKEERS